MSEVPIMNKDKLSPVVSSCPYCGNNDITIGHRTFRCGVCDKTYPISDLPCVGCLTRRSLHNIDTALLAKLSLGIEIPDVEGIPKTIPWCGDELCLARIEAKIIMLFHAESKTARLCL